MVDNCKTPVLGRIFLWNYDVKIVISDIDGTITKSDVRGQIMPLFGKDWSQPGIARLFTEIHENGYKFIYLSARSIVLSNRTRLYLSMVNQNGYSLPEGLVIVNPEKLFASLVREVIKKKPQEFKIPTLKTIQELFPEDCVPFYAAYGNKVTDSISYTSVGISHENIYIVNKQGVVTCNNDSYKTTYKNISDFLSMLFPRIDYAK